MNDTSLTADVVLEASELAMKFGRRVVLNDVSFSVRRGELVGIVGENGAGKTTLLRIVSGLIAPSGGTVWKKGRLGYCPQDSLVFNRLTVRENLDYFATGYGLPPTGPASRDRASLGLLERFQFSQYVDTLVDDLSAGTRQKLNLVVALIHNPDLILLDEPYSGFDWSTYRLFWEYAAELRSQGKSILVISHLVYYRSIFNRVLTLSGGSLTCD